MSITRGADVQSEVPQPSGEAACGEYPDEIVHLRAGHTEVREP